MATTVMPRFLLLSFLLVFFFFFFTPVACEETTLQHVETARFFSGLRGRFENAMASIRNTFSFSRPPVGVLQKMTTGHRYVAFGDSFAAGAGSGGGTYRVQANDFDRCCYRKRNAYPSLLMTSLGVSSFKFHACTGATILQGRNSVLRQLSPYMRQDNRLISLVTVTVGGNDMGFATIIRKCMFSRFGARKRCRQTIRKANAILRSKVGRDIRKLDGLLRKTFPNALVVFTGYPLPYYYGGSKTGNRLCRSLEIRHSMNDLSAALNKVIRRNVRNFVPISFQGREMCRRTKSWFNNGLNMSVRTPGRCSSRRRIYRVIGGFYHPTRGGQLQYSREIERWYASKRRRK